MIPHVAVATRLDVARMNKINRFALLIAVLLFAVGANAAPIIGFSVNSDSGEPSTDDSLYRIDLTTGEDLFRGELISGVYDHSDTEGLAFAPGGDLWGIDDGSRTLFKINTLSGAINFNDVISLSAFFPAGGGNDFGMTFSCDSSLYVTSVITRTLYRLDLQGGSETIGALGVNISAIAAIGNPTRLYGLGNGQLQNGDSDSPNLYRIDVNTGSATLIGPLGTSIDGYNEGGLAFDNDGALWAITDRSMINNQPSQILNIDVNTGAATFVSTTSEVGFESLAISPPTDCSAGPGGSDDDNTQKIPTLNPIGRLLAIFVLMLAGMLFLRRRIS